MFAFAVSSAASSFLSRMRRRNASTVTLMLLAVLTAMPRAFADKWTKPTPEELSMTSQPEVPGAAAVYLYREEIDDDIVHRHTFYVRLKVLTEKGRQYADVELPFVNDTAIVSVEARTIHADGTVVEFTGKPYTKMLQKSGDRKVQAKVFTLPSVEVGSIIEYRYFFNYESNVLYSAEWFVQRDLFVRKAYYMWKPYTDRYGERDVNGKDGHAANNIAWAQLLDGTAKVESKLYDAKKSYYELHIGNIMPLEEEESAPPIDSVSQRVLFFYTGATSGAQYWADASKAWSNRVDAFIGSGPGARAEVARVTASGDTPDAKLRKIYDDVMTMENTQFTRQRQAHEAKPPTSVDDVLARKTGSANQLTMLFIAMARAAGFKAHATIVVNRDRRIFWPSYLDFGQFDDMGAIVTLNGGELFFDPGQRDCPYGETNWTHSATQGIRQLDNGATSFFLSPALSYTTSLTQRSGDLKIAENGSVSGTLTMIYKGAPALRWRQQNLRTDETEVRRDLQESLQRIVPDGLEVTLVKVENLDDYQKPLIASFTTEGTLGTATAKRIIVPAEFFQTKATLRFSSPKRTLPIDMSYGSRLLDTVRIEVAPNMHWEAPPKAERFTLMTSRAIYISNIEQSGSALTFHRTLELGTASFKAAEYPDLREFYGKVATADGDQAIINLSSSTASLTPAGQPGDSTSVAK